jgi:hypothetical protein
MRKLVIASSLLALGITLVSAPVSAQLDVGAYASLPSGDYADFAKTGWMAEAGYGFWKSSNDRLTLWVSGSYGSNSWDDDGLIDGGKTNIMMGLGSVTYNITSNPDTGPYLLGHIGYLNAKNSADDLDFEGEGGLAFGGGLGYGFGKFWAEGRYITASVGDGTLAMILIGAGISF